MNEAPNRLTITQCRDAALALVLILLLAAYLADWSELVVPAIVVLVATMLVPGLFRPFAIVWWGLAGILAAVGSKALLTVIYLVVVTPVGLLRRLFGADPLRLREWGGSGSVLVERDKPFTVENQETPY